MAVRTIIQIDEDKCDGCGICVDSCAEGAIQIIDGKARLVSDSYCDGLGNCLADCPQDAITLIDREAEDYDEAAVERHLTDRRQFKPIHSSPLPAMAGHGGGCPGMSLKSLPTAAPKAVSGENRSQLGHWPVQLMLVPPGAPFLRQSHILLCADCVPFAVSDFHSRYLAGRSLLVGCPKLDDLAFYRDKLTAIFGEAQPQSITVLRMEVPCCGGIAQAAVEAARWSGTNAPVEIHTIGVRGDIAIESAPERKAAGL